MQNLFYESGLIAFEAMGQDLFALVSIRDDRLRAFVASPVEVCAVIIVETIITSRRSLPLLLNLSPVRLDAFLFCVKALRSISLRWVSFVQFQHCGCNRLTLWIKATLLQYAQLLSHLLCKLLDLLLILGSLFFNLIKSIFSFFRSVYNDFFLFVSRHFFLF